MQEVHDVGRAAAARIFENEADPAFRRRAMWIGSNLWHHFHGKDHRLLDIGCGRGFYFPLYHALNSEISGIERDPEPLSVARLRAKDVGADVFEGSADRLPFEDSSFDVAIMSEILEHLPSPGLALQEARRVLAPDGLLLITVPNANYPFAWDPINWLLEAVVGKPIRRGMLAGIWANHERLYTQQQLVEEVEASNFTVRQVIHHTHFCMPFLHNIVYGLGMPLLEKRLLPRNWADIAERGNGNASRGSRFNPVAAAIRLVHWFDRKNSDAEAATVSTVNICIAATPRPAAP